MRLADAAAVFWRRLPREAISVRAAALTYVSIFSVIPLLAIAVLFLEWWRPRAVHLRLQLLLREVLAPGIREQSTAFLNRYIHLTSTRTFGAVGLVALLISVAVLFRNLDSAINEIWRVQRKRHLVAQVLIYGVLAALGPIALGVSVAATAGLRNFLLGSHLPLTRPILSLAGIVTPIAALSLLYRLAPNTKVRLPPALIGGTVAGVLWEVAKGAYGMFAARAIRVNPIYGALGALPLFLIWTYLSWIFVLAGAHLAYSVQVGFGPKTRSSALNIGPASQLGAVLARELADREVRKAGPASSKELRELTGAHPSELRRVLEQLQRAGLVLRAGGDQYQPARPIEVLTLADVARSMADLDLDWPGGHVHQPLETKELFSQTEEATWAAMARTTWRDLASEAVKSLKILGG